MPEASGKIRVLVVDDSALMSRQIAGILQENEKIEVVGRAKDGIEALTMIRELGPDVITLDVEMPRMNGITALKHIMIKHGTPTVMISALTREGARTTFDALRYGAIDVIAKPSRREDDNLDSQKADIVGKVLRAAAIRAGRSKLIRMASSQEIVRTGKGQADSTSSFIVLGAGTGGYYSLLKIIPNLPRVFNGVLIAVIHVASRYIDPFVSYLATHSAIPVENGNNVDRLEKGVCYVLSGEQQSMISMNGDGHLKLTEDNSIPEQVGAIDSILLSLAGIAPTKFCGIIMTGAGQDGAQGLHAIRLAGGTTVIQDINTCMDPGMPLAALRRGSVTKILADCAMVDFITSF